MLAPTDYGGAATRRLRDYAARLLSMIAESRAVTRHTAGTECL